MPNDSDKLNTESRKKVH